MNQDTNALFLAASKGKLRFATTSGHLSVEDLWDLSLKSLDALAVAIDAAVTPGTRKTFLENPDRKADKAQADNELRLEILKAVIETKQEDNKKAREASATAAQRAFLIGLRDKKKMEALESLTEKEIDEQLAALGEA